MLTVIIGIGGLAVGLGMMAVAIVRLLSRPAPVVQSPGPPDLQLRIEPHSDEVDLLTRIGQVVSHGMDRVEAMQAFGADRFLTFMPMPDGTCWSLTVVYHPDEATAKASYRPVPAVTH